MTDRNAREAPPSAGQILRIAVDAPLYGLFDYLPPDDYDARLLRPGMRLSLPFGRGQRVGVLLEIARESLVAAKELRRAHAVLDAEALLDESALALARWIAEYYHHPLGEVLIRSLPVKLRSLRAARERATRGPRAAAATPPAAPARPPDLNAAQSAALAELRRHAGSFAAMLLEGVTGSGKTEVFLQAVSETLAAGRQALILVPEIGLTPQLLSRFRARLGEDVAVLHSGLAAGERLAIWQAARQGSIRALIGTRSAVTAPMPRLGLIVVDEEHDASFKQQEGLRYHARDVAVRRAQMAGVPIVLSSATPSLETLHNAAGGRYRHLRLQERARGARLPQLRTIDLRGQALREGLSAPLTDAIGRHLEQGGQALLFLNRRGFAPQLLCHGCGFVVECTRCSAMLTFHRRAQRLRCHHCGAERALPRACPDCGAASWQPFGEGTERIEAALAEAFPRASLARIDRDTTRRKGAFAAMLDAAAARRTEILVGTQMLAKGHDLPDITLVGVLNADGGLFSTDFRAAERLGQLITQVAGRAGRGDKPGEVLIQTHQPEHPLLKQLLAGGYAEFARGLLEQRRAAQLPPYGYLALLRAEAINQPAALAFLSAAATLARAAPGAQDVQLWGPVPALRERLAGRWRAQLLLQAAGRPQLHKLLGSWAPRLAALPEARRVRWSLDVDPQDLS